MIMKIDSNAYKSLKSVYARHGMVATSEPSAAQVGLEILKQGGNAIDAAIATAAALTVVEPTSNGIGGDNFALVLFQDQLHGLNSSGYAPESLTREHLINQGITEIPRFGFVPVTVPGAVKGWKAMHQKFGVLPFDQVLAPAIKLAKDGFIVTPTVSKSWKNAFEIYRKHLNGDMFKHWFDTFAQNNQTPESGDLMKLPDHAQTLQEIADTYGDSFYHGRLSQMIDAFSKEHNGYITAKDLSHFEATWVTPIKTTYKGHQVYEIPPNGQGAVALMALNIVEHLSIQEADTVDTVHKQIEAIKLAFADGLKYISDPKSMTVTLNQLLSKVYAQKRAKLITKEALIPEPGIPQTGGTVYLATADKNGNMVSMIQSNYMGFGSGLVVPKTGISLHNRGHNFSMDPQSSNVLAPLKKPYHTIIPGFLFKDNQPLGPFGVMGGFMQPQGHLQVIMNMIDFKKDPQEALDAPRFQWMKHKTITVEPEFNQRLVQYLKDRGHDVIIDPNVGSFGRGQIILRDQIKGGYIGGTEKRCDGTIASY
jgi:gamma-glutamyltranspeptidase / glutathione hydrolase